MVTLKFEQKVLKIKYPDRQTALSLCPRLANGPVYAGCIGKNGSYLSLEQGAAGSTETLASEACLAVSSLTKPSLTVKEEILSQLPQTD